MTSVMRAGENFGMRQVAAQRSRLQARAGRRPPILLSRQRREEGARQCVAARRSRDRDDCYCAASEGPEQSRASRSPSSLSSRVSRACQARTTARRVESRLFRGPALVRAFAATFKSSPIFASTRADWPYYCGSTITSPSFHSARRVTASARWPVGPPPLPRTNADARLATPQHQYRRARVLVHCHVQTKWTCAMRDAARLLLLLAMSRLNYAFKRIVKEEARQESLHAQAQARFDCAARVLLHILYVAKTAMDPFNCARDGLGGRHQRRACLHGRGHFDRVEEDRSSRTCWPHPSWPRCFTRWDIPLCSRTSRSTLGTGKCSGRTSCWHTRGTGFTCRI